MDFDIYLKIYVLLMLALTAIVSLSVIVIIFTKQELRNLPHYCIVSLTFCCLIESSGKFIYQYSPSDPPDNLLCLTQGWLEVFSETATYIWTVIISYQVAEFTISGADYNTVFWQRWTSSFFAGFVVPSGIASILLYFKQIGPAGHICFIGGWEEKEKYITSFWLVYLLFWSILVINTLLTCYVIVKLREYFEEEEQEYLEKLLFRYKLYPLVQFCCLFPSTIMRVIGLIVGTNSSSNFYISVCFGMLKPLTYIITYGLTTTVQKVLMERGEDRTPLRGSDASVGNSYEN